MPERLKLLRIQWYLVQQKTNLNYKTYFSKIKKIKSLIENVRLMFGQVNSFKLFINKNKE